MTRRITRRILHTTCYIVIIILIMAGLDPGALFCWVLALDHHDHDHDHDDDDHDQDDDDDDYVVCSN